MSRWTRYLAKAVSKTDHGIDKLRYKLNERFGRDELVAFPYLTYGKKDRFYIKGRVLEVRNIQPAREDASFWENFKNAYKRFESDEMPYARVRLHYQDTELNLEADDEGYFEGWLELPQALSDDHDYIQTLTVELISPMRERQVETMFEASVIVPGAHAKFGVISDMDDTVLQTGATSIRSMAKKTLFGNAMTRLPFEGVDAFYAALHDGQNPIFYVSSSPWNLYDVLVEFLDINGIPAGPLMLRDWGSSPTELLPTSHGTHKLDVIQQILDTYPELKFILIGDSGQEDPEIYTKIVTANPNRILGIYIRDVSQKAERDAQIQELAKKLEAEGHSLMLVPDTVTAATHAAQQGWIDESGIPKVQEAKAEDEQQAMD